MLFVCLPREKLIEMQGYKIIIWMSKCVYLHFVHMALFKHKRKKIYINQNDKGQKWKITQIKQNIQL